MKVSSLSEGVFQLVATRDEVRILQACINEALELGDSEFDTRVGASKEEALALFDAMKRGRATKP